MPHPRSEWTHPYEAASLDHVVPKKPEDKTLACNRIRKNGLVAHHLCNNKKGNRMPFACEVLYLSFINEKLALSKVRSRSY